MSSYTSGQAWTTGGTVSSSSTYLNGIVVGGGGTSYGGGGASYPGYGIPNGTISPLVGGPTLDLLRTSVTRGASKLTPPQLNQLLGEHTFIPMENSTFCLFCYALDMFRDSAEHIFVISEE